MKSKRFNFILTIVNLGLISTAIVVLPWSDSGSADAKTKVVCANNQTKTLKIRTACRSNEKQVGQADSLKSSGAKSAYDIWVSEGNKGTKTEFLRSLVGPAGASGSNAFSWADQLSCSQKVAQASAVPFHLKVDRTNFERLTGCSVKSVDSTNVTYAYKSFGLPYISSWEFFEPLAGQTLGGGPFGGLSTYKATYKVQVENLVTAAGDRYQICKVDSGGIESADFERLSDKLYAVTADVTVSPKQMYVTINLGIRVEPDPVGALPDGITADAGCFFSYEGEHGTTLGLYENPEILRNWATAGLNYGLGDYLAAWGW